MNEPGTQRKLQNITECRVYMSEYVSVYIYAGECPAGTREAHNVLLTFLGIS